jgi:class 3 adenylate cyclase
VVDHSPRVRADAFLPGRIYENVYLIVADASGYSTVVRHNPRDQAARAFDLLRERIVARAGTVSAQFRCARTQLWSWRGDGGILAIHDDDESIARDVALTTVRDILRLDLDHVRAESRRMGLDGEIRLRIAVHKSTIRYTGDAQIHSPDLNFAAHLEETTPPDCVAISEDVHRAAGRHGDTYTFVGTYENRDIHLMAPSGEPTDARRAWLATTGLTPCQPVFAHPQRPSQQEKARLVGVARTDIVDLGTALRTSARYLTTTERPAHYRDTVLDFLARGGTYRCVLLDPSCPATATLSEYRQEDLAAKIRASIAEFAQFKQRHGPVTDSLRVYQSRAFPGFAAIATDLHSDDPLILYSPYLMTMKSLNIHIDHGDSPHYLATPASGPLLATLANLIRLTTSPDSLELIL